jgi:hypothetical protein
VSELGRCSIAIRLGQTEIENLDHAGRCDLDICRFEIAMDDPFVVRGRKCIGDLPSDREGFLNPRAAFLQALCQRQSLHQFEHERRRGAGVFNSVNSGYVRMIERCQDTRLALESREPLWMRREGVRQDFDRDIAPEARVVCAVHLTHSASAKRRNHVVVPNAIAGRQPRRRRAAGAHSAERHAQLGEQRLGRNWPLFGERRTGGLGCE